MPELDTHLLVEGCRRQDKKAQKRLYYSYYSTFMNICLRYGRDKGEAEQLVHDSFLKVFGRIDSYKSDGSFEGWLKRICINTCLDNYKRKATFAGMAETAIVYDERLDTYSRDYVSNDVFKKLSVDAILSLVERLPEKEKVVFKLHVLDGFPHDEISNMIGIKPNHSYWLLHNARKLLQNQINKSA